MKNLLATKRSVIGLALLLCLPSRVNPSSQATEGIDPAGHCYAAASSLPSDTEQPSLRLSVLVFNHAEIGSAELEEAKRSAAAIFREVGIDVGWRSFSSSTGASPNARDQAILPLNVIFPGKKAYPWIKKNLGLPKTALGFALTQYEGDTAYVFVNLVEKLVHGKRAARLGVILGHIIAHELGHLLLGRGHSPSGLMSAEVGESTLRFAGANKLHFTREQAHHIREVLRKKIKTLGDVSTEEC